MSFVANPRLGLPGRSAASSVFAAAGRPVARAAPAVVAPSAAAVDRFVVAMITIDLVLMMLLQKWALPLSGESQVSMVLISHYAVIGVLLLGRRLRLEVGRLTLFAGFAVLALLSQIWGDRDFSPTSLLLGVTIYAALVVAMPINQATYRRILGNFQLVVVAVCLLVFLDHAIQLIGHDMPDIEKIQPDKMIYTEFVYIQPLYYGSPFSKPNAIFLLEASVTSQIIALGLVIEVAVFQRLRYLMLFGCALIATFAGTGLLLLLLSAPFLIRRLRPALIWAGVAVAVVAIGVAAISGWFEVVAKRLDEHEKTGSSAYARFIAPVELVGDLLEDEPEKILFGIGAGNIERHPGIVWMPFAKVIIEYGVIVFIVWFGYFAFAMLGAGVPFVIAWAVLVHFHLLNGSFLVPLHAFLSYALVAGYRLAPDPARAAAAAGRVAPRRAVPLTAR